jgi:hypothetical protein
MWLVLRRPLALAFMLGCTVSMLTSRTFNARLILDGALSYAFVPLFQIAAFAVVFRPATAPLTFAESVDRFFAGSTPWLLWMIGLCAAAAASWSIYWNLLWLELSAIPAIIWAATIDYSFYRDVMQRPTRGALRDLLVQRALGWSAVLAYFLGIVIRDEAWPMLVDWIGGGR